MAENLDVYREWLGITDSERPPNYYQLLRLEIFEDDQARIRRHYRKLNSHVRKFASGSYARQSQQLLNELARGMLCLTDLQRKSEYDESLGRVKVAEGPARTLEQILLKNKVVTQQELAKAQQYAKATGFSLRDALTQKKLAASEIVMQAYAESIGLPFLNLSDITIDEELFPRISAVLARTHSVAPVMIENDQLLLASPNPLNLQLEEDLKLRLGIPIRMVLCTATDIHRVINAHYPREVAGAELASRGLQDADSQPTGLSKVWERVKKWVEENNKK
ncbi:MAG: hypothetical protein GTO53_10520 [Planctomycetales bacterium]|nr:hypothetical protein [Planctomycetales bacterium]NIM09555.1 hypothetical protein [Planctomycetales bacterium]NIN09043.1 hypothetical protein [Planctomycetales bacterium]NIN78156.1 hypothetical protein [Planctomycetales bacterium]NIO35341.1 hypothetical protein [Planctomycetales bacterium]